MWHERLDRPDRPLWFGRLSIAEAFTALAVMRVNTQALQGKGLPGA
jgi:hypothetical protein